MEVKDKVVLITGTNRGIGKALVEAVLNKGALKVYATTRSLAKNIDFDDKRVIPVELDITDLDQIERVVEMASDTQVLVNNAGVLNAGTIIEGEMNKIELDMNVNYFATINMMRAFTPILQENKDTAIVNVVSIAAYTNFPFIAGYSASKAALYSATQAARIELASRGIEVFAINAGAIDTDMNKGSEMDMTSPEDVAKSICDELEKGSPDIIPDKIGRGMFKIWSESSSKLEEVAKDLFIQMNLK